MDEQTQPTQEPQTHSAPSTPKTRRKGIATLLSGAFLVAASLFWINIYTKLFSYPFGFECLEGYQGWFCIAGRVFERLHNIILFVLFLSGILILVIGLISLIRCADPETVRNPARNRRETILGTVGMLFVGSMALLILFQVDSFDPRSTFRSLENSSEALTRGYLYFRLVGHYLLYATGLLGMIASSWGLAANIYTWITGIDLLNRSPSS